MLPIAERAGIVVRWAKFLYEATESFEGELGMQLAYLWPAILRDEKIECDPTSSIVRTLKYNGVSADDPIWSYIDVVSEEN